MKNFLLSTFISLFINVLLHPTRYPFKNFLNVTCDPYANNTNSTNSTLEYPVAISWHVHITFMLTNKAQIARADACGEQEQK